MKKITLYEIYDCALDVELITNKLCDLEGLNNEAGDIFLSFVKNGLVNEDTIDNFIILAEDIESCEFEEDTDIIVNMINETLMNDYINNDTDYKRIIENYSVLLENVMIDDFMINTENDINYYKIFIIEQFNRIFINLKNDNIDKLYIHNISDMIDSYNEVITDLSNTYSNNYINHNEMLEKRIKYFVDIMSNKDIFELDDMKYSAVVNAASRTSNIEQLKVLKGIIRFNKDLELEELINKIDENTSELNAITIGKILMELKITVLENEDERTYLRNNVDSEKEREIIKKILKP